VTDASTPQHTTDRTTDTEEAPFRDAESFLASLGVERRPIVVRAEPSEDAAPSTGGGGAATGVADRTLAEAAAPLVGDTDVADGGPGAAVEHTDTPATAGSDDDSSSPGRADVSVAEATRIARETVPPDQVQTALSYIRSSTAAQPASEGRLRERLADRDHGPDVIEVAMTLARDERLVDDDALSAALVAEWRARGHAARRIRRDLRRRGFDKDVVARAIGTLEDHDEGAVAFDLARRRADGLGHVPAETAYRRVVGYLARRGYGEGLARKAARDAVYDQRHDERVTGH
jgi:regulatory protein